MAEDRVDAIRADIRWEANTGEVKGEVAALQRQFHESYGAMSADTLQVALAQQRFEKALLNSGAKSTQAKTAYVALQRAIQQTTVATNQHAAATDRDTRELGQMVRGALAGSGAMRSLGRNIAYASGTFLGGAGLISAISSTLRVAGQFQQQLSVLKTVTHATADEISRASDVAKQLGRDTQLPATSAKDAAIAMTELGKAGLSVEQGMAAARGTLQLAAAASISAADAAKITGGALNAFALSGDHAAEVADALAGAANSAQGEIPDMALALQQAATSGHQAQLSFAETVTAITALAKAGIQGSDAGTSLRVMLQRLGSPTSKAAEEMKELGVATFDARGQWKPFPEIISEYHDALTRLTPAARAQALQTIFGQDAQRAANVILGQSADRYLKLQAAVEKQGNAAAISRAKNRGYIGALDAFKSSVETLQIMLGTKLLPTFTETLKNLTAWVNRMDESGHGVNELVNVIEDGVDTVAHLGKEFLHLVETVDKVTRVVGGLGNAVELAITFGLIVKLRRAAESFGLMSSSSAITRTKVVADAEAIGAALDLATRPRTVQITTVQTGTPGAPGGLPTGGYVPGGTSASAPADTVGQRMKTRIDEYGQGSRSAYTESPVRTVPGSTIPTSGFGGLAAGLVLYGGIAGGGSGAETFELGRRVIYDTSASSYYLELLRGNKVVDRKKIGEAEAAKLNPKFVKAVKAQLSRSQFDFSQVGESKLITSAVQGSIGFASPGGGGPVLPDGTKGQPSTRTDNAYKIDLLNAVTPQQRREVEQRRLTYVSGQVSKLDELRKAGSPKFGQRGGEKRLASLLTERNTLRDDIKAINAQLQQEADQQDSDAFAEAQAILERRRQAAIATTDTIVDDLKVSTDTLALLRSQLAKTKQGTAEYENLRGQIDQARRDRAATLLQPGLRRDAFRFAELDRRTQKAATETPGVKDDLAVNAEYIKALQQQIEKTTKGTEEASKIQGEIDRKRGERRELLHPAAKGTTTTAYEDALIERERAAAARTTTRIDDDLQANADDLARQRKRLAEAQKGTAEYVQIQTKIDALHDERLQLRLGSRRDADTLRLQRIDLRIESAANVGAIAKERAGLRDEISALRKLEKDADYSESEQLDFVRRRHLAEKELKELAGSGTTAAGSSDFAKVAQQLVDEQRQIVQTYAPNFLVQHQAAAAPPAPAKQVTLNQVNQYGSAAPDPWLNARLAGFALKGEFDV